MSVNLSRKHSDNMAAKKTAAKLKKELDALVSRYVRLSYAKRGPGGNMFASCYTCGTTKTWKQMQCGHFIRRQYLATRFDLRNLRVQCVGCNIYGDGKMVEFSAKLEKETPGITIVLYREAQKITKNYPYESEIERYKGLLKKYKKFL